MMLTIARRLMTVIPTLIGVVIVTFLLTRVMPGAPAVYFAGPAAHAPIDRGNPKIARARSPAAGSVRALCERSRARQFRQFAVHRPPGSYRNFQPPAGLGRAHALWFTSVDRDRGAAWHLRCSQAGFARRSFVSHHRNRRSFASGVLHRSSPGLSLLFQAWLGARAARSA